MWSGPRNLSTAMMRSFGSRRDCLAMDEPFYAAYLKATGFEHPMYEEIIADGETDPAVIVKQCLKAPEPPHSIVYQKHMTHHMINGFETDWIDLVTNVFLIRNPAKVLASYSKKSEAVTAEDIGFRTQYELFEQVRTRTGKTPCVIDADQIRRNPEKTLRRLCSKIEIAFDPCMLQWEAGPKPEDGIWASHWYDAVWKSTGFAAPDLSPIPDLNPDLQSIHDEVLGYYQHLQNYCL